MSAPLPLVAIPDDNTISRASVFGIFLTLWGCILTQPYGSLLYRRTNSRVSNAILFFWRLHPLVCAAEAIAALYAVGLGCTRYLARRSPSGDVYLTASALLVLRAGKREPGGQLVVRRPTSLDMDLDDHNREVHRSPPERSRSYRDLAVDIVATLAMLTVIIKLAVSTLL